MRRRADGPRAGCRVRWEGFARFALSFAPPVLVAAWPTTRGSPPAHARLPPAGIAALGSFTIPLANASFRRLLAVFVLNGIAAAIPATLVLFFIEEVVRRPDLAPGFLVAYFAAGAAGLPFWVWLSRRIGKGRSWLAAMALSIVSYGWAFLLGPGDVAAPTSRSA